MVVRNEAKNDFFSAVKSDFGCACIGEGAGVTCATTIAEERDGVSVVIMAGDAAITACEEEGVVIGVIGVESICFCCG